MNIHTGKNKTAQDEDKNSTKIEHKTPKQKRKENKAIYQSHVNFHFNWF